ncbi:hypothetical protein KM043_004505 [Ampulex compressa]|nr:hypothetical protein KM043_004505 [Ampulex compressa]
MLVDLPPSRRYSSELDEVRRRCDRTTRNTDTRSGSLETPSLREGPPAIQAALYTPSTGRAHVRSAGHTYNPRAEFTLCPLTARNPAVFSPRPSPAPPTPVGLPVRRSDNTDGFKVTDFGGLGRKCDANAPRRQFPVALPTKYVGRAGKSIVDGKLDFGGWLQLVARYRGIGR